MENFRMLVFLFFMILSAGCETTVTKQEVQVENASEPAPQAYYFMENKETIRVDSMISIEYLMGKFDPGKHADFVKVDSKYASRADFYLRKDANEAFRKMHSAAAEEDIHLQIISATRTFSQQKAIWEAKWNGERKIENQDVSKTISDPVKRALKILEYSSMPGTSRHHWGTDIDLNALTNDYFESGRGQKEYKWLVENAPKFGFCQPYSPKGVERLEGYNEEKWHWSYLPVAKKLSSQYQLRITDRTISGFDGSETAPSIGIIKNYVMGINKACL